jgi:hypothetical protein
VTLGYSTVKDADLAPLSEAVAKWRNLPGRFTTIATSFNTEVSGALRASDWEGEAAKAALKKFDQVQKQMRNAADEAGDVHRLLDNALESFRSAQKRLRNVADEVSEDRNLKLSPAGLVYLDPDGKKEPERLAVLKQAYEDVVRGYNDRIKTALEDATEADTALHWALSQDPNGRSPGFHPDMFRSIREAREGRDQARKDADTLVELASLGPGMTDEQLERFNRLARKHEGDPYFAERFAVRTGPGGTLRFWQGIADQRRHSGDEAQKTLAGIQESLSRTLATASHSTSPEMERWKREVIRLGDERIYFSHPDKMVASEGSYGFSVMSSLMRRGEYETDFLKDYGRSLFAFERKHEGDLEDLWYVDGHKARLSFGSDAGNDPVAGYLEALGHNPEAAKEMFRSEEWENTPGDSEAMDPELRYLLLEREWMKDPAPGGEGNKGYGYDELGHALEAATLGIPYDQPERGLNRDDATANVTMQTVLAVGSDIDYVSDRPGIGDSLAKVGAGYIDDLNWAVSEFGRAGYNAEDRDSAFRHREGTGHFDIGPGAAAKFLASVGRHEGSYEILASAQQGYITSLMRTHSEPDYEAKLIIETGGKFNGMIDQARVSDIEKEYGESTEKAEQKLSEAAAWESFAVSQGIGVGAGILTLPFGGPAASAAVTFAVPAIVEGVAGATETHYEIAMERELKEKMDQFKKENSIDSSQFIARGKARSTVPLDAFVSTHSISNESRWTGTMNLEGRYNDGRTDVESLFRE